MPEVAFKLVHVVRALATATGVLAVDWVHAQSARTNAEDERVLRADGAVVLCVALHSEVKDGLLVLVL